MNLTTLPSDTVTFVFSGQGSPFAPALSQASTLPQQGPALRALWEEVTQLLAPVARDLLMAAPGASDHLDAIVAGKDPHSLLDSSPAVTMPGIALAQWVALQDLVACGVKPETLAAARCEGHSQGVFGVALARAVAAQDTSRAARIIAVAVLTGAAAAAAAAQTGATGMLSIRRVPRKVIDRALAGLNDPTQAAIALENGLDAVVVSGVPAALSKVRAAVEEHQGAVVEDLPFGAAFHSPLLAPALAQVTTWVEEIAASGEPFDVATAAELASHILVQPISWVETMAECVQAGTEWIVNVGPGDVLSKITSALVAGTGVTVVDASSFEARAKLVAPGAQIQRSQDWSDYAPKLLRLPGGRVVVDTAFTRLTGLSPIMLPGMTPTTAWPEIVAAAANAGHWAELAGGGQYTEEVFDRNRTELEALLEPGRTAGFNAMFFDRYMWNLQFGPAGIVPKARRAGSPLTNVTIAAGVPDVDEALELIDRLRGDGFRFLCFKPGTVEQINQVLAIARALDDPDFWLIIQVEDGHSGGHHSWEDLDDLLLASYARIRETPRVVLAVGGGIGRPCDAVEYLTGAWATRHGRPAMPVDAVMVGTATMATLEARTSPQVKQLLVDTPGLPRETSDGWVEVGASAGGMTSGLSHLGADMHEIDNSSARASRLIHSLGGDTQQIAARREEIIEALAKTAKPYFGDISEMTYEQWVQRFVDLVYPSTDWTWDDRALDLFHRVEARLAEADHGQIPTLFASIEDVADGQAALEVLRNAYPQMSTVTVVPSDVAWFPVLCRKHHKPLPFVPVLDAELAKWWGTDTLWQSHDARFPADAVRVIPGPRSVAGIDRVDEPVGELFARFEQAVVDDLLADGHTAAKAVSRLGAASDVESFLKTVPAIEWAGTIVANPAADMPSRVSIENVQETETGWVATLHIDCDTYWDLRVSDTDGPFAVRELDIPVRLDGSISTGAVPVVDMSVLAHTAYDLLAGAAGVGSRTINGDEITALPAVTPKPGTTFGIVRDSFTFSRQLGVAHRQATGAALGDGARAEIVPDALVGPCWPAIYAALGSATYEGIPVIEGLVNAVHLDHTVRLVGDLPAAGTRVEVTSQCTCLSESSAGRVVCVELSLAANGTEFAQLVERFAIRNRVTTTTPPAAAPQLLDDALPGSLADTPRSFRDRVTVTAPSDMTAFANVSGDFNPIHTSEAAAKLAGLDAPLVHGMWLSATAQHAIESLGQRIVAWQYQMFGMVNLGDDVEITVERTAQVISPAGGQVMEATCRVGGEVVSIGRAVLAAPTTAYVFPGQGIQRQGMGFDSGAQTPVTREIWARADHHTRTALGFSISTIVKDNPTEIRIRTAEGTQVLRHPQGVLFLTQFTQVALATLAYAQVEELRAAGIFDESALYAGHSLGEYNALAACARIFPLEQVLTIVYERGSAMHNLVERDAAGRSNYRLGALRPNQLGLAESEVADYVNSVAQACGEFIEIVNYNLAGAQYAIAGTVAGLEALAADAEQRALAHGGKRPFMLIPGIDVPFHSAKLRAGVDRFRDTLDALIPQDLNVDVLVGRYVPNLVARPFDITEEFARSILDVVPSQAVQALLADWPAAHAAPVATARTLLVELLAWQFASPVRWIETQDVLFDPAQAGVTRLIEVGLASAPTLANLASKTLQLPRHQGRTISVLNVERDEPTIYSTDARPAPAHEEPAPEPAQETAPEPAPQPQQAPAPTPPAAGPTEDLPFTTTDALTVLLAAATKLRPDQIDNIDTDTVDTLTNGVSSKRNQVLMDLAAELGVSTIDGAAEATLRDLFAAANRANPTYQPFGPVLAEQISARTTRLLGSAGLKVSDITARVQTHWGLGPGWANHVLAALLLNTREGNSLRGGELGHLAAQATAVTSPGAAQALIDALVQAVAASHGVTVADPAASRAGAAGATVDSAVVQELSDRILGQDGVLAAGARATLRTLGLGGDLCAGTPTDAADYAALENLVATELGDNWVATVTPSFDPARAILLDDRWATAREDIARLASGQLSHTEVALGSFAGFEAALTPLIRWYLDRGLVATPATADFLTQIIDAAATTQPGPWAQDVALVTGAAPGSIAEHVVAGLLAGGATVIMTASRVDAARLEFAKELYRRNARSGAALWLVPANLSSLADVEALIGWITSEYSQTTGATSTVIKSALQPSLFFPFAAPRVWGRMGEDPRAAMNQERLLLWSVERSIHLLAESDAGTDVGRRLHVVLPGSPNRGIFGGDGAYGQAKASFETIVNKWHTESGWPEHVTLAHPQIGWVAGTHLMGGNDALVPAAKAAGVDVYDTARMAGELLALITPDVRAQAAHAPVEVDLTGGLGQAGINLAELAASVQATGAGAEQATGDAPTLRALPTPVARAQAQPLEWGEVTRGLEDMVVMVGIGEISSWGSGRTRADAEFGEQLTELTAAGVLELAWMMGLVRWEDQPQPGWYDREGQPVDEADIYDRFHDQVAMGCGIRPLMDEENLIDGGSDDVATVFLKSEQRFGVDSQAQAEAFKAADPAHTQIGVDGNGQWIVVKPAGSPVRVPRRATLTRSVAAQIPQDFDPAHWGIPASMSEALDRIALWNLVTAVDAFISSGFSPAELLQAVHPADVSSTQGTGIGGMESLRKVFLDRFLGEDRPQDILQEALPNVVAAHAMQSYIGGYGQMIHPVGACATAAVSVEEGVDKILLGKSDFVVAGGIDDISVESLTGFGDMNATAESAVLEGRGIDPRFFSRAGDRRRAGFLEAMGGGTVLLARGSVAADLGLPVLGVVAYARSFADGAHTSIPAPGVGAVAAGRGGVNSQFVRELAALGATPDDITVVSKHDTSTLANDPNEAELHSRLSAAWGRSAGNPLYVVSQKTLTGHAKGGAALLQLGGIADMLARQEIPGNRALDCLDPAMKPWEPLTWLRAPLVPAGGVRGAVLTSLGFGHVSALVAVLHPSAFEVAVAAQRSQQEAREWRQAATRRLRAGARRVQEAMVGRASLFEPVTGRRLPDRGAHAAEVEMLLDPQARLDSSGIFRASR